MPSGIFVDYTNIVLSNQDLKSMFVDTLSDSYVTRRVGSQLVIYMRDNTAKVIQYQINMGDYVKGERVSMFKINVKKHM